jgi:hypothetical protein
MNVARDLLADLAIIGATVEPSGDRLILRAGSTAIPASLVRRVREAKADLTAMLAVRKDRGLVREDQEPISKSEDQQFTHGALEASIIGWLNQHPVPSAPGCCAWCGRPESPTAVVLPFGVELGTYTWLHAQCWSAWLEARRADAIAALGIAAPIDLKNGSA